MGKVRNILETKKTGPVSIRPDNTVFEALELMAEKNIGALLVMEQQHVVGIFTERDYARKVILRGKASKDLLVGEIMTSNPLTVSSDTSIEDCMACMTDKFIRHLPVIDDEQLTGIISIGDVVKFIIEDQEYVIDNLKHYITGI